MKTLLLTIGFALGGILTSFAQAQTIPFVTSHSAIDIPLTVDPTLSSIEITIADSATNRSPLSGTSTFDLQSPNTQITDLNLVLDESLNFSLFGGFASASTSPSNVAISLVTPGAPDAVSGTTFSQLSNQLAFSGDLNVIDALGFAGGNQTFDLSEVDIALADFDSVSITQLGSLITLSNSVTISGTVNLGASDLPVLVEMNYVASGIVPPTVLLGDINLDGGIDSTDIMPFILLLFSGGLQAEADCNESGAVNFLDIRPFTAILQAQ